jgi:tRNA-dihydrouridine synthase
LIDAAIDLDQKYSCAGIELNIGCPSPKIMSCEAGSGMLKNRKRTLDIIQSMSSSIRKPFSIKTRCGLKEEDKEEQKEFVLQASDYCSMITIHARTYSQSLTAYKRLKKILIELCWANLR